MLLLGFSGHCVRLTGALSVQLAGSGVSLSVAFPGMTQSSMLDAMDARTRALIDELPSVNVYPARQARPSPSIPAGY